VVARFACPCVPSVSRLHPVSFYRYPGSLNRGGGVRLPVRHVTTFSVSQVSLSFWITSWKEVEAMLATTSW